MPKNDDFSTDFAEGLPPIRIPSPPQALTHREPSCLRVFFAWELLRLLYNIPMAAIFFLCVAGTARDGGGVPPVRALFGCGGIFFLIVNVPFCLCHVFEVYLCWLGMRRCIARTGLFVLITSGIGGGFASLLLFK